MKELEACKPIYDELPGWDEDITDVKTWDELPVNAQNYLKRIEDLVGVKLATFSVGPDRDQTNVINHNIWA